MRLLLALLMTLMCVPTTGCLSIGGGFGAEAGPLKVGGSANVGPGPLLGNVGIDLRKKK